METIICAQVRAPSSSKVEYFGTLEYIEHVLENYHGPQVYHRATKSSGLGYINKKKTSFFQIFINIYLGFLFIL